MPYRVLLVSADESVGIDIERMLLESGCPTRFVASFGDAVPILSVDPPDVLLSALRLGPFNGCHLALRARAIAPGVHSVLFGAPEDHSADVQQLGLPMLHLPVLKETLLAALAECPRDRPMRDEPCRPRWALRPTALRVRVPSAIAGS